jgi:hypothetical protein
MKNKFYFKRFCALERYHAKETMRYGVLLFSIILGTYLVTCLLSYMGHTDSTLFVKRIGLLLFLFAPCLFERKMNSYNSVIDWMLPASVLEKYLHIWLKYYVITPVVIIVSSALLFAVNQSLPGNEPVIYETLMVDYSSVWLVAVFQPIFFTGYFFFEKRNFIYSLLISITLLLVSGVIISVMETFMPENMEINNLLTNPIYSIQLPKRYQMLITASTYAPILFAIGLWMSSYRLLKERNS